jgi:hypothetical protein
MMVCFLLCAALQFPDIINRFRERNSDALPGRG